MDSASDQRVELSLAKTKIEEAVMWAVKQLTKGIVLFLVFGLMGCVTPYKESNGTYIKTAQSEIRSAFGTNQSFARLERCDGPANKVLFYTEGDFTNCEPLKWEEAVAWQHGYSRGAGPEIVGAAIVGGSVGAGAALGGGAHASAGAAASATNIVTQSVSVPKGRH